MGGSGPGASEDKITPGLPAACLSWAGCRSRSVLLAHLLASVQRWAWTASWGAATPAQRTQTQVELPVRG